MSASRPLRDRSSWLELERAVRSLPAVRVGGVGIAAWSLCCTRTRRLTLGIKDAEVGNVHAPLSLGESVSASYRLVWTDGQLSRGWLERRQLDDPGRAFGESRAAAHFDADAAWIPEPGEMARVELWDAAAAEVARGDTSLVAGRLDRVRRVVEARRARTWSGSFSASEGQERLLSSTGIDADAHATSVGWFVTLDGELGDGWRGRRPETDLEFDARLERLGDLVERLREAAPAGRGRVGPVLLHPRVVEGYVLETLLHNLAGSAVANGESHFQREDFGADRPLVREDLGLALDPLEPLRSGSYRFTSEGVPAARCVFIERGRLIRPVLDLKYSRRLGQAPTPLVLGLDALRFTGPEPLPLASALAAAAGGVFVPSVLGVHTQDGGSGDFSLASPQAFAIGDGRLSGRVRGTISGNLFRLLGDERLRFIGIPGERCPGLLVHCRFDPQAEAAAD